MPVRPGGHLVRTCRVPLLQHIDFYQGIAGRVVLAAHDGGVITQAQSRKNR